MPSARRPSAHDDAEAPESAAPDAAPREGVNGIGSGSSGALRVLKKYPNRRLYDTRSSSYITLADVKRMVLAGEEFEVRDAKTAEDLTRSILLQIILEEESGGVPMFSTATLSQIIRFYGHAMQGVMGTMLEKNMAAFAELQAQFISSSKGLYDPRHLGPDAWTPFMRSYVDSSRAMFEQMQKAGTMFSPMAGFPPAKK
jgi:polyhydroxyalkanoate synthesis repressor PhaR